MPYGTWQILTAQARSNPAALIRGERGGGSRTTHWHRWRVPAVSAVSTGGNSLNASSHQRLRNRVASAADKVLPGASDFYLSGRPERRSSRSAGRVCQLDSHPASDARRAQSPAPDPREAARADTVDDGQTLSG